MSLRDEIALAIQQEMSGQMRYPPAADLASALMPLVERAVKEAATAGWYSCNPFDKRPTDEKIAPIVAIILK